MHTVTRDLKNKNYVKDSVTIITLIFLMWGFITVVNGFLVDQLKEALRLNVPNPDGSEKVEAKFITYLFYLVFFVVAYPASIIVEKIGFKKGLLIGLIVSASCSLFMVPGARELSYELVVTGIIVLATGVTILQVSANPYVILVEEKKLGASSLLRNQAFNSIGTWLAPLISVMVVSYDPHLELVNGLVNLDLELKDQAERVVLPYILFSVILVGITVRLHFSDLPVLDRVGENVPEEISDKGSIFKYKHVLLGALAIFCYVAAEVAIGTNLNNYIVNVLQLERYEETGVYLISYYWGSAMVGRFIGANLLEKVSTNKAIVLGALGASILLLFSLLNTGIISLSAILFVGLFNSILFPTIFAVTINGMGKYTAKASGLLNMAIIGGAIGLLGVNEITEFLSINTTEGIHPLKIALYCVIPLYIYIVYFGASGYKAGKNQE